MRRKKKRVPKIKKKIMRIRILLMIIIVLSISLGIIGIRAYFASADFLSRNASIGECTIEIKEEGEIPEELVPGLSIDKDVKVKNTGSVNCYVRIKAVFTDSDMKNCCTTDFNTTAFNYSSEDNYYYYPKVLKPGETTESLLTTINIDSNASENDLKSFDVIVYAEAVQSVGFASHTSAWETFKINR